jgi:glycerophosphoryl diester phosphodiesterase
MSGSAEVQRGDQVRFGVALALLAGAYAARTPVQPPTGLFGDEAVAVVAHRGASAHAPENTLPAFDLALQLGAHALEMDLHLSADGHVVVIHDATVDRTTDGSGRVGELTVAELRALDAGHGFTDATGEFPYRAVGAQIPTLGEVLERYPRVLLVLDIKSDGGERLVDAVAEVIAGHDAAGRVLVTSFESSLLRRFRTRLPGAPTGFGRSEMTLLYVLHLPGLHRWYRPPAEVLLMPEQFRGIGLATPRFLRAAERLGLDTHIWTINDEAALRRMVALGFDAILTDYPDRLHRILGEQ